MVTRPRAARKSLGLKALRVLQGDVWPYSQASPQSQKLDSGPEILWEDDFGKRDPCCLLILVPSRPSQSTSCC